MVNKTAMSIGLITAALLVLMTIAGATQAFASSSYFAYVPNSASSNATIISYNMSVGGQITDLTSGPYVVAFAHDGRYAYIGTSLGSKIYEVNTSNNSIARIIQLGSGNTSKRIEMSPDDRFIYAIRGGANPDALYIVNRTTGAIIAFNNTVPTSIKNLELSPDGQRIYISATNTVYMYYSNLTYITAVDGLNSPQSIVVSPDNQYVYVQNWNRTIFKYYASNLTYIANTVAAAGSSTGSMCITPDGRWLYEACTGTLNKINTSNFSTAWVSTISLSSLSIAASPDNQYVYAVRFGDNNCSIIGVDNNTIVTTVPVGTQAYAYGGFVSPLITTPPTASFTSDVTSGITPLTVQFTDTSTDDPTSWEWDFGDGTPNSTSQNPSHEYSSPGTYTVILTSTNAGGSSTIVETDYITAYLPVVPSFTADTTSGTTTLTVHFTDTSTGSPTSWAWNFGDGTPNSTSQNPSHTYTNSGTSTAQYTVMLTASKAGSSDTTVEIDYITVNPTAPVAGFTANRTSGGSPLAVQFTDTSTGATSWFWNFGDGTTDNTQNPAHTYTTTGLKSVSLTVTNDGGTDAFTWNNYIKIFDASITGPVNSSERITMFNDTSFTDIISKILPNDTDNFDLAGGIYAATKPLSYNGVGDWWIVIVIFTVGAIILLSQGGSPFLLVLAAMIGNVVLWVFLPLDVVATIAVLAILDITLVVLAFIRPGRDR